MPIQPEYRCPECQSYGPAHPTRSDTFYCDSCGEWHPVDDAAHSVSPT